MLFSSFCIFDLILNLAFSYSFCIILIPTLNVIILGAQ